MKWEQKGNYVENRKFQQFDIGQILECGQTFRFKKMGEGHYRLIAFGQVLNIQQDSETVRFSYEGIKQLTIDEFERIWLDYFDLKRDYGEIQAKITKNDPVMQKAVDYAPGIRILQQDPWEMTISFIISQNNRIPQIQRIIENICKTYGTKIADSYFAFPTPAQLKSATAVELRALGAGYRDEYIINAVVHSSTLKADNLTSIKGIGEKVAHCIRLFGYGCYDSFPIDVWVKRVMCELYFEGESASNAKIKAYAEEKFGEFAGFAQQYLFHYIRTGYEKTSFSEKK